MVQSATVGQPATAAATEQVNENRKYRRAPHDQKLTLLDAQKPKAVEHLQVIGYFDPTSIKFDRHNSLVLTIAVPPEFVDEALKLRYMTGVPLSIDFQRWTVASNSQSQPQPGSTPGEVPDKPGKPNDTPPPTPPNQDPVSPRPYG